MIFGRGRKRRAADAEPTEPDEQGAEVAQEGDEPGQADAPGSARTEAEELAELDELEWRDEGPFDISEVEDTEPDELHPRIDLGSMILTGLPGAELRLQVAEETNQIVSAMLILTTVVEPSAAVGGQPEAFSSALELSAYAAPRSGGLWAELRDEISQGAVEAGGSASLASGPFGVELRRLVPVTTPDGQEGYQPSRMWVAEGPRWLLRGIVYGQAAIEEDLTSPAVADVLSVFRKVVVRRGDEAMAPGDLLPIVVPAHLLGEPE